MKTKPNIITLALLLGLAAGAPCRAAVFQPNRINYDTGRIAQKEGNPDLAWLSVQPTLVRGNVTAVVDFNLIFDKEFRLRDHGNDVIVLDSVDVKREHLKLHYGDIEGMTLGRGFIVSNYYSNIKSNVPSNEDKGFSFETATDKSKIKAFGTVDRLFAGRAERNLGRVTLGSTVALDHDPDLEIFGVDAKLKIVPDRFSAYWETADIVHSGNGFAIGGIGTFIPNVDFTVTGEYRKFDSDFAPGIIDEHYDAKPLVDTVKANTAGGKVDGFHWTADYKSGDTKLKAIYEDYRNMHPRATFGVSLKPIKRVAFDVFYAQENFVPSGNMRKEDSVIIGRMTVPIAKYFALLFDYYRAFDDNGQPLESLAVRIRVHKNR